MSWAEIFKINSDLSTHKIESLKLGTSLLIAYIVSVFNKSFTHRLFFILLIVMCFDTLLGWLSAHRVDKWHSDKAKWGAVGKIVQLCFVWLVWFISLALAPGSSLPEEGLMVYFIIVELASIIENLYALNVPIPKELVHFADTGKNYIGRIFVIKLKDYLESITKVNLDKFSDLTEDDNRWTPKEEIDYLDEKKHKTNTDKNSLSENGKED